MSDMDTALANLIGSRICHDLISPIGAINNGIELLNMSGDPSGPEMGLISESVDAASARIRFFRIAFGAAGDQMVGPGEVNSILRDLYEGSRLDIDWQVQDSVQRADVRLAFLALLCVETALPYGGRVELSHSPDGWQMRGIADRVNTDGDMWQMLNGATLAGEVAPSHVQFALLPRTAKDMGRDVRLQSDETSLLLRF